MRRRSKLGQRGQTSMEYMLMLVVSAGIAMTAFKRLDDYLLSNPNSFINKQLNSYKKIMKTDPRYRQFPLAK